MTDRTDDLSPPTPLAPPESLGELVREHPELVVAGGLAVGLLLGALLPRRAGGRLSGRAMALAGMAAEFGLALSRQAGERASHIGHEGRARLGDLAGPASASGRKAAHQVGAAGDEVRRTGLKLAQKAVKIAADRLR